MVWLPSTVHPLVRLKSLYQTAQRHLLDLVLNLMLAGGWVLCTWKLKIENWKTPLIIWQKNYRVWFVWSARDSLKIKTINSSCISEESWDQFLYLPSLFFLLFYFLVLSVLPGGWSWLAVESKIHFQFHTKFLDIFLFLFFFFFFYLIFLMVSTHTLFPFPFYMMLQNSLGSSWASV